MDCQDPTLVLQGLRNGKKWAFECLVKHCLPSFVQYVSRNYPQLSQQIEDMLQDSFVDLITHLNKHPDFIPKKGIYDYFFAMLKNKCAAMAKRHSKMPINELNMDLENDEQAYSEDVLNAYCSCLEEIRKQNPKAAAVLESQYARYYACSDGVEYKTDEELGEELETTEGYIGQLRHRGRKELEECMQKKLNR